MSSIEWLGPLYGSWVEPVAFGLAMILALLGAECLLLAQKTQKLANAAPDDELLLGAEFGIYAASNAGVKAARDVPRKVQLIAVLGGFCLLLSMLVLLYSFA